MIYLVMRDEGLRSDGYYYESHTSIIGARENEKEAVELLACATTTFHANEKPVHGKYGEYGDTERGYRMAGDLYDVFWVKEIVIGATGDNLGDEEEDKE